MPSFNFGTILLVWYFADHDNIYRQGAPLRYPWCYSSFRENIGYPQDDGLLETYDPFAPGSKNTLPGFSDQEFFLLQAYVTAFGKITHQGSSKGKLTEHRHAFVRKNTKDGHNAARDLIGKLGRKIWWDANKFNEKIDRAFKEEGIHPFQQLSQTRMVSKDELFDISPRERTRLIDTMLEIVLTDEPYTERGSRMAYPVALDDGLEFILQIVLNRYRRLQKRHLTQYDSLKTKADQAMSVIETMTSRNEKITIKMVRSALLSTKKLMEAAQFLENHLTVRNHLDLRTKELGDILGSLSTSKQKNNHGTRFSKISPHHFECSATAAEIDAFDSLFLSISSQNGSEGVSSLLPSDDLFIQHGDDNLQAMVEELWTTGDMGVEDYASMSPEAIRAELGWSNGFDAPSFQPFRHVDVSRLHYTAWTHPTEFSLLDASNSPPPPEFIPQRTKWVQLAGIASLIKGIFTQANGPKPGGILLADEVGVGKTLHALGVIGFVNQIIQGRSAQIPDPPILKNQPYFAGMDRIPQYPHLIVVPHGLVLQWQEEARIWFKKGSVDIFTYSGTVQSHRIFWGKQGPYQNSEFFKSGELSRIVIIASQNAVASDSSCVHGREGIRLTRKTPWELPGVMSKLDMKTSIHGQTWLTVFIDEAHAIRRRGSQYQYLVHSTCAIVCATATPLHTGLNDLVNTAHLLRLPALCSETGYNAAVAQQRKVDRLRMLIPKDEVKHQAEAAISGTDHLDSPEINAWRVEVKRSVKQIGLDFKGHIIRRMVTSKDWKGSPISALLPYQEAVFFLDLTESEYSMLKLAEERELQQKGHALTFDTKAFYVQYRQSILYPKDFEKDSVARRSNPTIFTSVQKWKEAPSTKLSAVVNILQNILSSDDRPIPSVSRDGSTSSPPTSASTKADNVHLSDQVILYVEFSGTHKTIHSVLNVYGINSKCLSGSESIQKRDEILRLFHTQKDEQGLDFRVLIISSVGGAGLNISCANWMIFVDQPWSAQDERQLIGRIWRQPQTKVVKIMHLLATDTTDIVLHSQAQGKAFMLDLFLVRPESSRMLKIAQGHEVSLSHDEESEDLDRLPQLGGGILSTATEPGPSSTTHTIPTETLPTSSPDTLPRSSPPLSTPSDIETQPVSRHPRPKPRYHTIDPTIANPKSIFGSPTGPFRSPSIEQNSEGIFHDADAPPSFDGDPGDSSLASTGSQDDDGMDFLGGSTVELLTVRASQPETAKRPAARPLKRKASASKAPASKPKTARGSKSSTPSLLSSGSFTRPVIDDLDSPEIHLSQRYHEDDAVPGPSGAGEEKRTQEKTGSSAAGSSKAGSSKATSSKSRPAFNRIGSRWNMDS